MLSGALYVSRKFLDKKLMVSLKNQNISVGNDRDKTFVEPYPFFQKGCKVEKTIWAHKTALKIQLDMIKH